MTGGVYAQSPVSGELTAEERPVSAAVVPAEEEQSSEEAKETGDQPDLKVTEDSMSSVSTEGSASDQGSLMPMTEEEILWQEETARRMASSHLPKKFDLKDMDLVGKVRKRLTLDDAWAFAAIGALESRVRIGHENGGEEDFSVNNLLNYSGCDTPSGGDQNLALAYFAAQKGPVDENLDPYKGSCSPVDLPIEKAVLGAYFVSVDEIKEMIYNNRTAVQMKIHMTIDPPVDDDPKYYSKKNAAQYVYSKNTEPNEDILIVGWDDEFPHTNFEIPPLRDGAFICQSSRGTKFGENGYFYLSYSDKSLQREGAEGLLYNRVNFVDSNKQLYQHDEYGMVGVTGTQSEANIWFANIFNRNYRFNTESLESVSFYTLEDNLSYQILVNTSGQSTGMAMLEQSDSSGLRMVKEGKIAHRGYHTIDLDKEEFIHGSSFAVMVRLFTSNPNSVALEYKHHELDKVEVHPGQSFIRRGYGDWQDVSKEPIRINNENAQWEEVRANVCLKATTKGIKRWIPEPEELRTARFYGHRANVYSDKVWHVKFSDEIDEEYLKGKVKVYQKDGYQELKIHYNVEFNPATQKKDTLRVFLKPEQVPSGFKDQKYETGKEYILYIGKIRSKETNKKPKKLDPIKFHFTIR